MAGIWDANPLAEAICKEPGSQWSEVGEDDLSGAKAALSLTSSFLICAYTLRFRKPSVCRSAELRQQTIPLATVIDSKLISYSRRS